MAQIRITPDELKQGSSFLVTKMNTIVSEVSAIESRVNAIAGEWEGAAQGAFVNAFHEMLPMLKEKFPEIVQGIADQLQGAAETLEQADTDIATAFGR